jgi:ubiquinone/menaquinone biosynthesis C-methylase UbiE
MFLSSHHIQQKYVEHYINKNDLFGGEQLFAEELKSKLILKDNFLDIGIGAGRTTSLFSGMFDSYTGIDIDPDMINEAVKKYGNDSKRNFLLADATALSDVIKSEFDAIFFSFNGIDYILDKEKRKKCLREIYGATKKGGYFCYSTHNIGYLQQHFKLGTVESLKSMLLEINKWLMIRIKNKSLKTLLASGIEPIYDGDRMFTVQYLYSSYDNAVNELTSSGFSIESSFNYLTGEAIDPSQLSSVPWLGFICKK